MYVQKAFSTVFEYQLYDVPFAVNRMLQKQSNNVFSLRSTIYNAIHFY